MSQRDARTAPYFNRRDQYRMLAMVGLLCLVIVAIKLAAMPSSWYWLLPPDADTDTGVTSGTISLKELDFRVKETSEGPLPPDVFRAVAANDDVAIDTHDDRDLNSAAATADNVVDDAIAPEVLAPIEDNTIGVLQAERTAYFEMLDRVRRLPDAVRSTGADDDVAFTVIMLQPEDYRGRLTRITGQLRRLTEYPVMENDVGIEKLYEGWLFTGDSGNNPWRFFCTSLPPGVRLGESIDPIKCRVDGYFFKRMGYASQGGQHVAPTLLASSFEVLPPPVSAAPQMQAQMRNWMLGIVGTVIVALAVMIWWFIAADRRSSSGRVQELAAARLDANPQDLEALREVEVDAPAVHFERGATKET